MEMLNQKQKIIGIIVIAIVILVIGYYYINSTKDVYASQGNLNIVEESEETEVEQKNETIKVHITGAVKKSGIVEIEEKSRIGDAIEAAGGITEDANLTDVNLAYVVQDGQKICIPSIDEKQNTITEDTVVSAEAGYGVIEVHTEYNTLVNINKANVTELMIIPGIGEATAAKIIEYRKTNGNFKKIEDIKKVSGIGDSKYNTIKEYITV